MRDQGSSQYEGSGPPIQPGTLPDGVVGLEYSQDLEVVGGAQEGVVWSVASGSLPDGLTLDTMTGPIAGTPTAVGEFTFAVDATVQATGPCAIQPGYAEFIMIVAVAEQAVAWS